MPDPSIFPDPLKPQAVTGVEKGLKIPEIRPHANRIVKTWSVLSHGSPYDAIEIRIKASAFPCVKECPNAAKVLASNLHKIHMDIQKRLE
jgi:hypothetical protein